jgi:hypothetical protein
MISPQRKCLILRTGISLTICKIPAKLCPDSRNFLGSIIQQRLIPACAGVVQFCLLSQTDSAKA